MSNNFYMGLKADVTKEQIAQFLKGKITLGTAKYKDKWATDYNKAFDDNYWDNVLIEDLVDTIENAVTIHLGKTGGALPIYIAENNPFKTPKEFINFFEGNNENQDKYYFFDESRTSYTYKEFKERFILWGEEDKGQNLTDIDANLNYLHVTTVEGHLIRVSDVEVW